MNLSFDLDQVLEVAQRRVDPCEDRQPVRLRVPIAMQASGRPR